MRKKWLCFLLTGILSCNAVFAYGGETEQESNVEAQTAMEQENDAEVQTAAEQDAAVLAVSDQAYIEETLNLANNEAQSWTYSAEQDAWVLAIVSAVAYPELQDQQGVSVCVPGAYVTGIDTDGDGTANVTAETYVEETAGSLVIDYEAEVVSSNG